MASSTKPNLSAVATPALTDIISVRQSGDTRDKKETLTQLRSVVAPDATTAAKGLVELATDGESAASVVVQGNDSRLSDSRPPSGAAGGALSGTYPNPTVDDDGHSHTKTTLPAIIPAASYLAANATSAVDTMAASGLTVAVTSGRKYVFRAVLRFSESVAADGSKIDFDTSAAATDFRYFVTTGDDASTFTSSDFITALATDFGVSAHDNIQYVIEGSYEPSASGNLLIRFAQNLHTTGTLTLFRGSYLMLWDMT